MDELRVTLTASDTDGASLDCERTDKVADKKDCELLRVNINDNELFEAEGLTDLQRKSLIIPDGVMHTGWPSLFRSVSG